MPDRIQAAAGRLRWAVLVVWVCVVLAYIAGRSGFAAGPLHFETRAASAYRPALVGDASVVLMTVALWRVGQMLAAVAAGDYFSSTVIQRLRSFAFWLLLLALLWLAAPIVSELLRDQSGPVRRLAFAFSIRDLLTAGITLILFLVARLLERARQLDEEVREFV